MEPKTMILNTATDSSRKSILKEYYARYLTEIRGVARSSVNHYLTALNTVSDRLRKKSLVANDIYELMNLEELGAARSILFADPEFKDLDTRGRRMYSAGFNNYYRFVSGDGFQHALDKITRMDLPIAPEAPDKVEQIVWKRSNILRTQALVFADYKCELGPAHETFLTEIEKKPYMEGHHAIPMRKQDLFKVSLDVYANIVCLCPLCHRRIHYGLEEERIGMIHRIYDSRSERLANSGLRLNRDEFTEIAIN